MSKDNTMHETLAHDNSTTSTKVKVFVVLSAVVLLNQLLGLVTTDGTNHNSHHLRAGTLGGETLDPPPQDDVSNLLTPFVLPVVRQLLHSSARPPLCPAGLLTLHEVYAAERFPRFPGYGGVAANHPFYPQQNQRQHQHQSTTATTTVAGGGGDSPRDDRFRLFDVPAVMGETEFPTTTTTSSKGGYRIPLTIHTASFGESVPRGMYDAMQSVKDKTAAGGGGGSSGFRHEYFSAARGAEFVRLQMNDSSVLQQLHDVVKPFSGRIAKLQLSKMFPHLTSDEPSVKPTSSSTGNISQSTNTSTTSPSAPPSYTELKKLNAKSRQSLVGWSVFFEAFDALESTAMQLQFHTLCYLWVHGGVHLHPAFVAAGPLAELLPQVTTTSSSDLTATFGPVISKRDELVVVADSDRHWISPDFIAVAPRHPFIAIALVLATQRILDGASFSSPSDITSGFLLEKAWRIWDPQYLLGSTVVPRPGIEVPTLRLKVLGTVWLDGDPWSSSPCLINGIYIGKWNSNPLRKYAGRFNADDLPEQRVGTAGAGKASKKKGRKTGSENNVTQSSSSPSGPGTEVGGRGLLLTPKEKKAALPILRALDELSQRVVFWTRYPTYGREDRWYRPQWDDEVGSMWKRKFGVGKKDASCELFGEQTEGDLPLQERHWQPKTLATRGHDGGPGSGGGVTLPHGATYASERHDDNIQPKRLQRLVDMAAFHAATVSPTRTQRIPLRIMQTNLFDRVPAGVRMAMQTIIDANPHYSHHYYSDKRIRGFLTQHFNATVVNAFDELIPGAYKSDLFRYCYLYIHGGVFLDGDSVAVKSLDALIGEDDEFVSAEDAGTGWVYNAFVAVVPKHPIIHTALEITLEHIQSRFYGRQPQSVTGPLVLKDGVLAYTEKRRASVGYNAGLRVRLWPYERETQCMIGFISTAQLQPIMIHRGTLTKAAPNTTWAPPVRSDENIQKLASQVVLRMRFPTYKAEMRWYHHSGGRDLWGRKGPKVDAAPSSYQQLWKTKGVYKLRPGETYAPATTPSPPAPPSPQPSSPRPPPQLPNVNANSTV